MPKFRVRASGAKSRIRYEHGQSSSSNPKKNKHRSASAALRNASVQQQGLVAVDDRAPEDAVMDQLNLETMSLGKGGPSSSTAKSMVSEGQLSAVSAFTSCTNPNFESVHRAWQNGGDIQAELVSVLAAVADIIKEKGGSETDIEYMAALLVTLEGMSRNEPSRVAATAHLLHLIIKKVPTELLQANFTSTVNILYTKLLEHTDTEETSILKNLLAVLGVVLRAQPAQVWTSAQNRNILVTISSLCNHSRPWVRTMARRVTRAILTNPVTALDNGLHAASHSVANHILQQLQQSLGSRNGSTTAIRHLCLLEGILHKVPATLFKQLTETILRSFSVENSEVKASAMQCLQRALDRQPCDAALSAETCGLLVESLRGLAPPTADTVAVAHWMQTLTSAQICLSAKDPSLSYSTLEETLHSIVRLFDVANESTAALTYQCLSRIVECCVQDEETSAKALLGMLHKALHVQSAPVWRFVVRSQMRLFERAGPVLIGSELVDTLRTLAEMRQAENCQCKPEIDFTVGSAIRHIGAGAVLSVIGLQLDPDAAVLPTELSRSWLIPVLRVNLHNAPLSLFLKYFLPLAIKLHRRLASLETSVERVYSVVQLQLWELLPHFLETPTDFETTFPTLAPILGTALQERKDLRMVVLSSIRAALKFSQAPDAPLARSETMARFAKNFQPLLFNLYTDGAEDEYDDRHRRLSSLETIRLYADSTPRPLIAKYVESALNKVEETASDPMKQSRILDVVAALVKNADEPTTATVLEKALVWTRKQDKKREHLQKKGYRILEEVLRRRGNPELDAMFASAGDLIIAAVVRPVTEVVPQARAAEMGAARLVLAMCKDAAQLTDFALSMLKNVLPMLDKAQSTPARASASKGMQEMMSALIEAGQENGDPVSTMLAPLLSYIFEQTTPASDSVADIPLSIAQGALVALNIIAQKQLKHLNASHVSQLLSHASTFMADGRPPVRVLAIRLLRVLVQKMSDMMIGQFRELILSSFFGQDPTETTVKIRKANRLLLDMLMERVGGPIVQKAALGKAEWAKLAKSVEKQRRRRVRAATRTEQGQGEESDDDDAMSTATSRTSARTAGADTILALLEDSDEDDEDADSEGEASRVGRRKATSSVWLKEDDEAMPIDLLDRRNLVKKVSTTDPAAAARRQERESRRDKNGGFAVTKDGKLVIDMDDEQRWKRKKRSEEEVDEMPEKRRKVEQDSDEEDDEEGSDAGKSGTCGWKPGGKGIHRDTRASVISGATGVTGVSRASTSVSRAGGKKGNGKGGRKGQQEKGKNKKGVQPYAYVPLKNMKKGGQGKQELKSLLGRKRKAAGSKRT